LLGLPQELRDQIFRELFHIAPTLVMNESKKKEQSASTSENKYSQLTETLPPTSVLYVNKQLHAEAQPELCKSINATRLVLYCNYPTLIKLFELAPKTFKSSIRKVYATSLLMFSYQDEWNRFIWRKRDEDKPSPICEMLLDNFALEELAIYTPSAPVPYYISQTPHEVCHLLEMGKVQRVQFVYRHQIEYDQDCEELFPVQRILRGAHAYPNENMRREKSEFLKTLQEWEKLPKKFDVHREDDDACRDELWWAAGDVLAREYSAEMLKRNGVRNVITLTLREDLASSV
jgi:hypothetical protein